MLYVDANVLIGVIESGSGKEYLVQVLLSPSRMIHPLHTCEITFSEVLVAPLPDRDHELIAVYRELFSRADLFRLWPVTTRILEFAAALRAQSSMRLPDGVHMATASIAGCRTILSHDKRLFIPPGIQRIDPFTQPAESWIREAR